MNLEGRICRLRAVEPRDVAMMYAWENDTEIWSVSGTTAPYSHELLERFVEQQRFDLWQTRQMRLMIEPLALPGPTATESTPFPTTAPASYPLPTDGPIEGVGSDAPFPIGALDLFDFDPQHRRAGIGILIHDPAHRGKGFAADALTVVCDYARTVLGLHQLWCNIGADNAASLALFRRAGFADAGCKRDWQWTPDGYRDELLLQKIL